ncbi:MAG: hypothetical protein RTU92_04075 [Candidatus Thorarchaeota archaeon]
MIETTTVFNTPSPLCIGVVEVGVVIDVIDVLVTSVIVVVSLVVVHVV